VGVDGAEPMKDRRDLRDLPMVVLWENHRKTIGKWWLYPLVNIQKTMENHHAING
jgi:hypothetical protein